MKLLKETHGKSWHYTDLHAELLLIIDVTEHTEQFNLRCSHKMSKKQQI